MEAIQENPDDEDFSDAFWENNEVIKMKKKRIQDLLAKIWDRDPIYFRKIDKLLQELLPDTPPENEKSCSENPEVQNSSDQNVANVEPDSESISPNSHSEETGLYL